MANMIENIQERDFGSRMLVMAVCAIAACGALWQGNASLSHWAAVLVPAVLWPLLVRWLNQRTKHSDNADVFSAFIDGIIVGAWVALASFNLLASITMLLVLVHCKYALQTPRHAVLGIAGAIAGVAVTGLVTGFTLQTTVSTVVVLACALALAVYLTVHALATGRLLQTVAHKEQMLNVLRRIDALTGYFGRGYWNDMAARLFSYARANDTAAFMLIVDIDQFREINARRGEAVGDEVIIAVANTLRTCVRPSDATCRFGGDAFGVLLSGVHLDIANQIADRIHHQVLNRRLRDFPDVRISVSIGIASLAKHHQSAEEWIKQTETSLEQAKGAPRITAAPALQPLSAEHLAELAQQASTPASSAPA